MDEFNTSVYCSACETRLKRQVVGSNVLYYCRKCGRMSSAACLFETPGMLKEQAPVSGIRTPGMLKEQAPVSGIRTLTNMECTESNPELVTES